MKCKINLKVESATSRQNIECIAVKKKAYVLITADILLLVTYKIHNSANIVRINIKCAVSSVSN